MKNQIKLALYLTIVTFICGIILFYMNKATTPLINKQEIEKERFAMEKVLPNMDSYRKKNDNVIEGLNMQGKLSGYIFKVKPSGYSGKIDILVGIANKKIVAISVLNQSETPGLGAKIIEESWLKQFQNKSVNDSFKANQDLKAITGATISSEAVGTGIREAIKLYKDLTILSL
jgi:Na+-translocating ferredoxin:NAD+ oxidoreductase subunit G